MLQDKIIIRGARENNLKNISLEIPKGQITVFTGVSGSGKSSIVFDTVGTEAQRQLNETYTAFIRNLMPRFSKPDADAIENLSVAIVVDQKPLGGNSRSTLGTITDIYSLLRLLFSRFGKPYVGYSNVFSFNDPQGMCSECHGIGKRIAVAMDKLFDSSRSLNEGAILFPFFSVGSWYWKTFTQSGLFDNDKKLADFSAQEWETLLYGKSLKIALQSNVGVIHSDYEGVVEKFTRLYITRDISELSAATRNKVEKFVVLETCSACKGARLNKKVLTCLIEGLNIAAMAAMEVGRLKQIIESIQDPNARPITSAIGLQLDNLIAMGLDYISLDRETATLSGGESQRVKMVKYLSSSLTNLIYIFDEPSVGLHPRDVDRLNNLLKKLRDSGNTILVVEHDPDVIKIADHIIDVGPYAGNKGGEITYNGNYEGLISSNTLTGKYLNYKLSLKTSYRTPGGYRLLSDVSLNNLKSVTISIPENVLTVVTGVAGSGKSTLINHAFLQAYPEAIIINQSAINTSIRSNPATFTGIMDEIRNLFAAQNNVSASLFSFNSKGACDNCSGLGFVYTDLAFLDGIRSLCEVCQGKRFKEEVLQYKLKGKAIHEVLHMTFQEAADFFDSRSIVKILNSLIEVGIGYLTLGQPLSTLSGGECQRIKLAKELHKKGSIYLMDEPTTGLHMSDIDTILNIINRLVDRGNSVIVIEHNLDIIKNADWIIDMGPEGGKNGGQIIFEGTPVQILEAANSLTGKYLKKSIYDRSI